MLEGVGVQIISLFRLNNGRSRELSSAKFGKQLCRLCKDPISDFNFNCFQDFERFLERLTGFKKSLPVCSSRNLFLFLFVV